MNTSRAWRATAVTALGLALLAACGSGDDDDDTSPDPTTDAPAAAPATTAAAAGGYDYGYEDDRSAPATTAAAGASAGTGAALAASDGPLGTMLVDADGLTLYAFTTDTEGVPTCEGACAEAWPPALVDSEPTVEGVDAAIVSTVDHPAGGTQLAVDGHPLYTFAGDAAPGDVNGQGSGDLWFAVAPDGTLIP